MRTALELLRPGGVMTVCVYYGGPQGMAEKDAVLAFLTGLPPEGYRVSVRDFSGRRLSAHPRLHRKAGLVNGGAFRVTPRPFCAARPWFHLFFTPV